MIFYQQGVFFPKTFLKIVSKIKFYPKIESVAKNRWHQKLVSHNMNFSEQYEF